MTNYYTGVGSRDTPPVICELMTRIARDFARNNFILRSGGANGADMAFEAGAGDLKEIYLPWPGFNGNSSTLRIDGHAFNLARTLHPVWDRLSPAAQKLHARNCHQVLGQDLKTPSMALICWTKGSQIRGGTATAIRLAMQHRIPIHNLARNKVREYWELMAQ